MADEILRRNLDRAFDPGPDFPHAMLLSRTIAMLVADVTPEHSARINRRPTWLMPIVAALLAVAIVATLVLTARALHPKASVPAHPVPPQQVLTPHIPTAAGCDGYQSNPGGVNVVKTVSSNIGWAEGGLLTTDGGSNWIDVSPSGLRRDEPAGLSKRYLPPGFADFYLDAEHAWEVRTYNYGSSSSCYDHIVTFMTSDGGRTWQQSLPIALSIQGLRGNAPPALQLDFIDAQQGWLLVQGLVSQPAGLLYVTGNGGHDWRLVSSVPVDFTSCGLFYMQIGFASRTTGWFTEQPGCRPEFGPPDSGSPRVELQVTRDGGTSWNTQQMADPPGGCGCAADPPVFFDENRGVIRVYGNAEQSLLVTSDGGQTWRARPPLPGNRWPAAIDFADPNNFWALETQPGWHKGDAARDWLYHSGNGGLTWSLVQQDLPIGWPVGYLHFVDSGHGFAVEQSVSGVGPLVLRSTSDGGRTWVVIKPHVS
jgi:photosystem II stability/assembly factor-like uncharacterized protein